MMLIVVKGPTSYDEICKVGKNKYDSFRDACFAMGFLGNDREYIGAIKEVSELGSDHFLWKLLVIMFLSDAFNYPANVWDQSWFLLSDGILHEQRQITHNPVVLRLTLILEYTPLSNSIVWLLQSNLCDVFILYQINTCYSLTTSSRPFVIFPCLAILSLPLNSYIQPRLCYSN